MKDFVFSDLQQNLKSRMQVHIRTLVRPTGQWHTTKYYFGEQLTALFVLFLALRLGASILATRLSLTLHFAMHFNSQEKLLL